MRGKVFMLYLYLLSILCIGSTSIAVGNSEANVATSNSSVTIPNPSEEFVKNPKEINFTWDENETADIGVAEGNVGSGNVTALIDALEKDGFDVQQGKAASLDFIKLVDAGLITNANGNNANNPYKMFIFPPVPGQPSHPLADKNGWSPFYRLRPDEAIIYVGTTPPECAYFGYQTYMYTHYYPSEGRSKKVFANVGDSINILTAHTNSTDKNQFNKAIMVISTADKETNERISALQRMQVIPLEY